MNPSLRDVVLPPVAGTGGIVWLAANGLALVLLAVVLGGWARARPRVRRRAIAGAVCLTLGVAVLLVLFKPAQVPIGWITVLQEGRSIRNVQQLYGQGAHFGPGFVCLSDWLTGHDVTTLPAVVHMNLCLAVVNTIIFFFLASYVLPSWWASLAFTAGYACNLNTLHAAFSELPAMVCTTHFWLGCIAAAVIDDADAAPGLRRLALFWLALLVTLAALIRAELLLVGGPAVAVGVAKAFGWETEVRRAARTAGRLAHAIVAGRWSIFVLAIAALAAINFLPWMGEWSYVIDGIAPLNFSFVLLPQKLGVFLPFGLIALFILGLVYTLQRWLSFVLLPLTLLTLYKVYASATQGIFEGFRYMTLLTPIVLFVALFGVREVSDWAQRWAWPPWWKRLAVLLLALSMIWQPLGPRETFGRRQQLPGLAPAKPLLGWNQQTEVRYLLDLVARYPTCVFLAKTVQAGHMHDEQSGYRWAAFGGSVAYYRDMPDAGEGLEQVARQLAPGAACVLFYQSLDCNLIGFDGCQTEMQGRMALEERVLENLPYSDIGSYGAHRAEIRLGVYPVVLQNTGSAVTRAPQG
jgi:hypothetical protein